MAKGGLTRWERALERWEGALVSRARRHEPVELLEALRRECDSRAIVCSESRVVAPNAYDVELDTRVHEELVRRSGGNVGEALTDDLARHGERMGYEWVGPLTLRVSPADRPSGDPYRVSSSPMPHVRADAFPDD